MEFFFKGSFLIVTTSIKERLFLVEGGKFICNTRRSRLPVSI